MAIVLAVPAGAAGKTLVPGVSYQRKVIQSGGKPVVLHIVRTPPQSDLYRVRPVLSGGKVLGRQTVPAMQRKLSARATTVGVNGDFFKLATGASSGMYLRDGVLSSPPALNRSALAVDRDGSLSVDIFRLAGSWRAGSAPAHPLQKLNRRVETASGIALFTPRYGGPTPKAIGAVEVVLSGVRAARLDTPLTGTVTALVRGGRTPIPASGAVLQARGTTRARLLAEAPLGTTVTVRLRLPDLPAGVSDAIGGGPVLVRDGKPIRSAGEAFTLDQIARRHPRTAAGQTADGGLLFVAADGRSTASYGLTYWALARTMADLGAVTAIGFDGGGSSTLAFDGKVLNVPSDGRPRAVANGLFLHYYGIYAPPAGGVVSPNGDGVGESKTLVARIPRRSQIHLRLRRPDGSVAWRRDDVVGRSRISRVVSGRTIPEGIWRWEVEATDVAGGQPSAMTRTFRVNRTIGHLRLSRRLLRVTPKRGGRLGVKVRVANRARVGVAVLSSGGRPLRTLFSGQLGPGWKSWRWNGRTRGGRVVGTGAFTIRVTARNSLGTVALRRTVRVRRVSVG